MRLRGRQTAYKELRHRAPGVQANLSEQGGESKRACAASVGAFGARAGALAAGAARRKVWASQSAIYLTSSRGTKRRVAPFARVAGRALEPAC
ncbi:MAG TPA: hypothetical protein VER76_08855 [Pyrinomonadaceae bacterium]|nr:hypothetical protein [Pyrinomonadaceae bacterium]